MTTDEVARQLDCSRAAVWKAIRRGTLRAGRVPGGRRGAYYVIDPLEVERYRKNHRTPRRER